MTPILLPLAQKNPMYVSGTCMASLSNLFFNPAKLQLVPADLLAILLQFTIYPSRRLFRVRITTTQLLHPRLQDSSYHALPIKLYDCGHSRLGPAWSSTKH